MKRLLTVCFPTGISPFKRKTYPETLGRILSGVDVFVEASWRDISDDARHLIESLLATDPAKRVSAFDALHHPWFSDLDANTAEGSVQPFISDYKGNTELQTQFEKPFDAFSHDGPPILSKTFSLYREAHHYPKEQTAARRMDDQQREAEQVQESICVHGSSEACQNVPMPPLGKDSRKWPGFCKGKKLFYILPDFASFQWVVVAAQELLSREDEGDGLLLFDFSARKLPEKIDSAVGWSTIVTRELQR